MYQPAPRGAFSTYSGCMFPSCARLVLAHKTQQDGRFPSAAMIRGRKYKRITLDQPGLLSR
jgi:hypothetical protein